MFSTIKCPGFRQKKNKDSGTVDRFARCGGFMVAVSPEGIGDGSLLVYCPKCKKFYQVTQKLNILHLKSINKSDILMVEETIIYEG